MILLTIHRNTSTTVSLFAGLQVLSIISVRSVSNTCSIGRIGGKKSLKSKGLLTLFGPVNPGGENRGPKNMWKSRNFTMSRGRRPTRQNRELKSADCNHIVDYFFDRSRPFIVIARWITYIGTPNWRTFFNVSHVSSRSFGATINTFSKFWLRTSLQFTNQKISLGSRSISVLSIRRLFPPFRIPASFMLGGV